jgi:hypothetical protein
MLGLLLDAGALIAIVMLVNENDQAQTCDVLLSQNVSR